MAITQDDGRGAPDPGGSSAEKGRVLRLPSPDASQRGQLGWHWAPVGSDMGFWPRSEEDLGGKIGLRSLGSVKKNIIVVRPSVQLSGLVFAHEEHKESGELRGATDSRGTSWTRRTSTGEPEKSKERARHQGGRGASPRKGE